MKNHQHLPKVSNDIRGKEGKKKLVSREKKESKNIAKKKSKATSISKEQPTNRCGLSNLSSRPRRPRGMPPRCKKNRSSDLPSQPKRPRGRRQKKQEPSDNYGDNYQLIPVLQSK